MVVRQFMLPSDSLSNIVSLLSLVTHTYTSRCEYKRHGLDMDTVTHTRDMSARFFSTLTQAYLTFDGGELKARFEPKKTR